jgi:hypothetical protein
MPNRTSAKKPAELTPAQKARRAWEELKARMEESMPQKALEAEDVTGRHRDRLTEAIEAGKKAYAEFEASQLNESNKRLNATVESEPGSSAQESPVADDVRREFNAKAEETRRHEPTLYTPTRIERVGPVTMPAHTEKPGDKDPGQKGIERLARRGRRFADVPFEIQ